MTVKERALSSSAEGIVFAAVVLNVPLLAQQQALCEHAVDLEAPKGLLLNYSIRADKPSANHGRHHGRH